jgi:potassium-dependent mechanosensitive channel
MTPSRKVMTKLPAPGDKLGTGRRRLAADGPLRTIAIFLTLLALSPCLPAQSTELTSTQRQWLSAHKVVHVAPDPGLAPIDGIDADGHPRGLSADYLKLISTRTGLEFRVVRVANHGDAMLALSEHRADLVPATPAESGATRNILYTAAYLRLSAAVYVRSGEPGFKNLDQIKGHSIGLVEGSPWAALLGAQDRSAKPVAFADIPNALQALRDKKVDAFVGDPFSAADAIARLKFDQVVELSGQLPLEVPLGFAVRGDWPALREILDNALKSISVDEEKSLRERWLKNAAPSAAANAALAEPSLPPSQARAIEAAMQAAAKIHDPELREKIEELLRAAQDDDAAADGLATQWQSLGQSAAGAEAEAQKLEDTLAQNDTTALLAWRAALPERASVEQLQTLLVRERADLAAANSAAAALQVETDRQT